MAFKRSRDISMDRSRNQPIEIRPIKHITPEFWRDAQDLFIANYQGVADPLPYSVAKFSHFAVARKGEDMVGFIMVMDFKAIDHHNASQITDQYAPIWQPDRPSNLNSREIEICWVHHRHRRQGIATRLYQYALTNLRATHINIDPHRVWDDIAYWRGLGFTKCILYSYNQQSPGTRLHIEHTGDYFYDLDQYGLWRMYADRDISIPLTPKQQHLALSGLRG